MTRPAPRADRLDHLDALRGFALCGISVINVAVFADLGGPPGLGTEGAADRVVAALQIWLVESKFFSLFSLLFGVGFDLQKPAEPGGVWRFVRRLVALAGFGAAHILLLWEGDILLLYALVGPFLLPFRRCRPRALVWWAVGLLAGPLAFYLLALAGVAVAEATPAGSAWLRKAEADARVEFDRLRAEAITRSAAGGFREQASGRAGEYGGVAVLLLSRVPTVLAMFLLGLAAARSGLAADPLGRAPLLRRVRWWGLGVGLPLALLVAAGYLRLPLVAAFCCLFFNQALAGPVLALGYAAAFTLVAVRPGAAARLAPLAALGQMALTNYLLQSLAFQLVFSGLGLGLVGRVSAAAAVGVALTVDALHIAFSLLWLRRFRFGPMEWVWRTFTYAAVQPLRRPPPA